MASTSAESASPADHDPQKSSGGSPRSSRARGGGDTHEQFIEQQIRRTRWQVKLVDLFSRLTALVCGVLTFLFLLILADHWLVPGGLGWMGRTAGFAIIMGGAALYFVWQIVPVLLRPINPLYAAYTIEQARPSTRNSLINYLLLKRGEWSLHRAVVGAIRRRAADDLTQVDVEHVVDRGPLLRVVYWLLVIVALLSFYKLFSPKDPLRSIGRVLAPWSELMPPTRVSIDEVQPGSTKAFQGDVLEISARVRGIEPDEPVMIYYTTDDQQVVERPIEMHLPSDGYRHRAPLPDDAHGLAGSLSYTIVAGDARRGPYRIQVLPAPSIVVEEVEYHFPAYTGLASKTVAGEGDLQAIEGTRVVVHARANMTIERAWLDRGCDGRRDVPMNVAGQTAHGQWTLTLGPDGQATEDSYQIRFTNNEGFENPRPVRYRIRVLADQPPVVEIRQPESIEVDVPADGSLKIAVAAEDPDFALSELRLKLVAGAGRTIAAPALIPSGREVQGAYEASYTFKPQRWKLKPGDTVVLWAEAVDNRRPEPQRSESDHYRLRITLPEFQPPADRLAKNDRRAAPSEDGARSKVPGTPPIKPAHREDVSSSKGSEESTASGEDGSEEDAEPNAEQPENNTSNTAATKDDGMAEKGEATGSRTDERKADEGSDPDESSRIDPEANPGDAFEKILEHVAQQPNDDQQSASDEKQAGEQAMSDDVGQSDQSQAPSSDASGQGHSNPGDSTSEDHSQQGNSEKGQGAQGDAGGEQPTQGDGSGSPDSADAKRNRSDGADGDAAGGESGAAKSDQPKEQQQDAKPGGQGGQPRDESNSAADQPASRQGGNQTGRKAGDSQSKANAPRQRQSGKVDSGRLSHTNDDGTAERRDIDQPRKGRGDKAQQSAPERKRPPSDRQNDDSQATGGEPHDAKGNSGAGQSQGNQQGAPSPQEKNQPRNKQQSNRDKTADDHGQGEQATSPSTSPKESDSQGGEEGDRSGGGQEGGGQKANAKGTGGAGQNTASDEGGSSAQGSGQGPTANRSGDRQPGSSSNPETTSESQAAGQGKSASEGGQASTSGGQSQQKQGASGEAATSSGPSGSGRRNSASDGSSEKANRQGDGGGGPAQPGARSASSTHDNDQEPGGDRANLDYARRATELAIEHLKDQLARDQLDQKLLKKLGWTRADVERFVAQWERMRRQAEESSEPEARHRFEQALRSLGLRPRTTELQGRRGTQRLDLRQSQHVPAPLEYREQFRAYTEATAKARPSRRSGNTPSSDGKTP